MNGVDGILIVLLLAGGFLGLRFSRGFIHLSIIFIASIFALCVAAYFTAGVLRLSPIQTFYVVAIIFAFLFALPTVVLFTLKAIDRVEANFIRPVPNWLHIGGGAVLSLAISWVLISVVMMCVVLASMGGFFVTCATSGLLWDIWTSTLTISGANFINWFTGVQGLVLFIILGLAFIVLAIRGPRVAQETIWDATEREVMTHPMKSKIMGHMLDRGRANEPPAFSQREYLERKAREEQASQQPPATDSVPPPAADVEPIPEPEPEAEAGPMPEEVFAEPEVKPEPEPTPDADVQPIPEPMPTEAPTEPEPVPPPAVPPVAPQPAVDEASPAAEHLKQAETYEKSGAFAKAVEAYDRAIEADEGCAIAYFNRGQLYMFQKKTEEAAADLRKAIEVSDDPSLTSQAEARLNQLGA